MTKSDPLLQLWLAAVMLTRLPLPHLPQSAFALGARAVWAYPVVGIGIGALGALTGQLAMALGLPVMAAAALTLAAMILITGAMHEDGLADVFDGFWGGFTSAKRLEIMRDSQIGTYGVLALIVTFTLRLTAVAALLDAHLLAIVAAAALSRGLMPVLMYALPHARSDGLAHSVGHPTGSHAALACAIGGFAAVLCVGAGGPIAILATLGTGVGMAILAKRKIGGQTGDVLGATQQLSEVAILLTYTALL